MNLNNSDKFEKLNKFEKVKRWTKWKLLDFSCIFFMNLNNSDKFEKLNKFEKVKRWRKWGKLLDWKSWIDFSCIFLPVAVALLKEFSLLPFLNMDTKSLVYGTWALCWCRLYFAYIRGDNFKRNAEYQKYAEATEAEERDFLNKEAIALDAKAKEAMALYKESIAKEANTEKSNALYKEALVMEARALDAKSREADALVFYKTLLAEDAEYDAMDVYHDVLILQRKAKSADLKDAEIFEKQADALMEKSIVLCKQADALYTEVLTLRMFSRTAKDKEAKILRAIAKAENTNTSNDR